LRDYEIVYIVRPDLDEDQLNETVNKVTALIETLGGRHDRTNVWGKRRLAYEVNHLREGYYVLTEFQIESARVPEMESTLKISDTVFRHLIVRKPEPKKAANGQRPEARSTAAPAEAGGAEAEAPLEAAAAPPEGAEPAEEDDDVEP
jgi:small subunit ribosomal protein S6